MTSPRRGQRRRAPGVAGLPMPPQAGRHGPCYPAWRRASRASSKAWGPPAAGAPSCSPATGSRWPRIQQPDTALLAELCQTTVTGEKNRTKSAHGDRRAAPHCGGGALGAAAAAALGGALRFALPVLPRALAGAAASPPSPCATRRRAINAISLPILYALH